MFRYLTDNPEAYALYIRVPPDALRVLWVCLEPVIVLRVASGSTSEVCCVTVVMTAAYHVFCSFRWTPRV